MTSTGSLVGGFAMHVDAELAEIVSYSYELLGTRVLIWFLHLLSISTPVPTS